MPRFPRIYADATVPARLPSQDVPLAAPGQGAEIAAGQSLERTGLAATEQGLAIENQLRKADAGLELDQAMTQLKVQFADREQALKDQGLHPDAYAPAVNTALNTLGKGLLGTMRYPEAQAAFQQKFLQFQGEQGVKAVNDGWKMKHGMIELGWSVQQTEDATTAVFGTTPEERQAAFARGLARPDEGLRRGFYTPEQAAGKLETFLGSVEKAGAIRDFRNPVLQDQVIQGLLSGTYKHLTPPDQLALAKNLQDQKDTDLRRQQADAKAADEVQYRADFGQYAQGASTKSLTLAQLEAKQAGRSPFLAHDYIFLKDELAKAAPDAPSDEATRLRVVADTHSQYPRMTERQLLSLRVANQQGGAGLNMKDYLDALDHRRSAMDSIENRADARSIAQANQTDTRTMATYHAGLAELQTRLGVPTMWEKLDQSQKKAWSMAAEEYRRLAWPLGPDMKARPDAMNPQRAVDELAPRFLGTMGADARMEQEKLLGMAKVQGYGSALEVNAAFQAGRLDRGHRDNLLNLFTEIQAKQDILNQETKDRTDAATRAKQFERK